MSSSKQATAAEANRFASFARHEALSSIGGTAPLALISAPQATFQVTTLVDTVDASDGLLSLREAIDLANDAPGEDTITFADAIRGGTINLIAPLSITDDLTIAGDPNAGFNGITLHGLDHGDPPSDALIGMANGTDLTLQHTTIDGWYGSYAAISGEDGIIDFENSLLTGRQGGNGGAGAGIRMPDGAINVTGSAISSIGGFDGFTGIEGDIVRFSRSTLEGFAENFGGAIAGEVVIIDRSTFQDNLILDTGGIILADILDISDSTFANNVMSGNDNSVITVNDSFLIYNSTFVDNQTSYGGATSAVVELGADARGEFLYVTMTGTGAESPDTIDKTGTGIFLNVGSTLDISNTIIDDTVNGNLALLNVASFSSVRDYSDDLFLTTEGTTLLVNTDPARLFASVQEIGDSGVLAGVAADNGGPTQTVALLNSSLNPAIDNASGVRVETDQRGVPRGAAPDIGAFEVGGTPPLTEPLPPLAEKVPLPDSEIVGAPLFLVGPASNAAISFVDEVSAFQSSLGVYLVGPDGTIGETRWAFDRIEHSAPDPLASLSARPGDGPLTPGDAVQLRDLFDQSELQPGTGFGLFLVADGAALNPFVVFDGGSLAFRSGGNAATVTDRMPELVHIAENGVERVVQGNIMHTIDAGSPNPLSNSLNPGGTGQVTSGLLDRAFTVAFEDKPLNGSDRDFNDALFSVDPLIIAEETVVV